MRNTIVVAILFGPGLIGTALWWYTNDPAWLFGWLITLILGLAG
jgi:hypothetical protein